MPGKFELAVKMTRIMFPFLLLVALAAQAMGVLNACNRFAVPALASTFFNIGSVVFGLAFGYWLGPLVGIEPITGMAIGVVLGGALQLIWQMPSLRREGFGFHSRFDWNHPGLAQDLHADGSGDSGQRRGADQRDGEHKFRVAHSWQRSGELAGLRVPLHAIAAGIVRRGHRFGDAAVHFKKRGRGQSRGIPANAFEIAGDGVPFDAALVDRADGFGRQHDRRDLSGRKISALSIRIRRRWRFPATPSGLAGYSALKVLNPAFYALHDARTPMLISLISIAVNYFTAALLLRTTNLSHAGSGAFDIHGGDLSAQWRCSRILRNRIGGIYGRNLANSIWRITLASAVMGVRGMALESRDAGLARSFALGQSWRILAISIPFGVGGVLRWLPGSAGDRVGSGDASRWRARSLRRLSR